VLILKKSPVVLSVVECLSLVKAGTIRSKDRYV
jgi:hypothetical protein